MSNFNASEHRLPLISYMNDRQNDMLEQTRMLADLNSGSYNNEGIERVQKAFEDVFNPISESLQYREIAALDLVDDEAHEYQFQPRPMQIFRARPEAPLQLLMTGHSDTVFPKDFHFQTCEVKDGLLHGPGTADMKGGLVVLAQALEYLNNSPLKDQFGFTIAISPDEEIGSISSGPVLMELAKEAHFGLTYEPALSDGTLAGARKGSGNFTLTAKGKSTHAGRNFFDGRNAVVAIAKAAEKLSQITNKESGITLNVGRIIGGGAVNIVPDNCLVRFNVRVENDDQARLVEDQISLIIEDIIKETDCELKLHGHFNRPAKPMTDKQLAMFELLKSCGQELGLDIQWKATGGCCEGNNLAAAGLVNIDTLGVRGANIHTDQEYTCIDSFPERAALTVTLIEKLIEIHNKKEG